MSTLTNYEGLLALSASPHMSDTMRSYLVGELEEHRQLLATLREILPYAGKPVHVSDLKAFTMAISRAHAVIAKADPAPITIDPELDLS